LPGLWNLFFLW